MQLRARFGGCLDCDVTDFRVLTNDHLDQETKHRGKNIRQVDDWTNDLEGWVEEFLKCCARCHRCHNISTAAKGHYSFRTTKGSIAPTAASRRGDAERERSRIFRERLKQGSDGSELVNRVNKALTSHGKGQLGKCVGCGYGFDSAAKTPACTFDHLDRSMKLREPSDILTATTKPETTVENFIVEMKRAGFGVICANCDHLQNYYKVEIYEGYDAMMLKKEEGTSGEEDPPAPVTSKGRKRNPKLDRAVEAVLAGGVGQVPLRNALLAGGFSEIESSTKSVRDQLSRRLRNLRKEKEAQSLAAGRPSSPEKGGSSSSAFPARNSVDYLVQHARKFLEHHRPVAAILDSNEREAFIDRFRELMERESHAYSLTSSFGRGTFSTVNHQPIPTSTPAPTSASTPAPTSMGQYQPPPHSQFSSNHDSDNNTPTLTSTSASASASSTPVATSKFTTLATSIPVVGGVPQTWVAHHNHMHSMNCTHEAKRHRPNDGSAPHLDFLIRDGDRTFVECYGGVNHAPTAAITSLPSTLCSHGVEATACSKTPGTPKSVGWVNPNLPTIMNLEDVNLDEFDDWDEEDWKLLQE